VLPLHQSLFVLFFLPPLIHTHTHTYKRKRTSMESNVEGQKLQTAIAPEESAVEEDVNNVSLTAAIAALMVGYVKCSLCNNIIADEAIHLATEHGHVQHLKAMLDAPLQPPPPATHATEAALHDIGTFVVATSRGADRGPEAFRVMQRARMQLHRLFEGLQDSRGSVYAFGSVVSMGCWDGVGDGDFALVEPKWFHTPALDGKAVTVELDKDEETEEKQSSSEIPIMENDDDDHDDAVSAENPRNGAADLDPSPQPRWETDEAAATDATYNIPPNTNVEAREAPGDINGKVISAEREKSILRSVASRLRDAGFHFDELDPVLRTRIPVVKRKRPMRDPLDLRAMHQDHLIRVYFDRSDSEELFRRGRLHTLISTYNAREVPPDPRSGASRRPQLTLAVPDSVDAVHLMSRRERIAGVRKQWVSAKRTPELFAIDFDLSCRYHGIRNSWLLRKYFEQDEVFRMGNVFLKKWSKNCGINNSRMGFLTSYAICVLWVYFLLRRGAAAFVNPSDVPVLPDPEKQMEVSYIPLWPPLADNAADAARTTRLGALLRDFFFFYGEEFDWATQVVTIRQPCPTAADVRTKADLRWLADDTISLLLRDRCYHIFSIEDVYEDNLDLGRHLTEEKASWTRLQFRLAYARCGGKRTQLMRLLDVPRKRANDVLRVRLFRYLLHDTDKAEATVRDLLPRLCCSDDSFPGEDPEYLLGAYELGNRLSDLWYDEEQVGLDMVNHKKHDRRANLYSPPLNPTKHGEWAVVCSDPLPVNVETGETGVDFSLQRKVSLKPPNVFADDGLSVHNRTAAPQSAPKRQREVYLNRERNRLAEANQRFGTLANEKADRAITKKAAKDVAVVGFVIPKSDKDAVYPHCFYELAMNRLFDSYDARDVFVQCLQDVAWELARLREEPDASRAAILTNRQHLYQHLQAQLHAIAAARPGYEEVLHFVVADENYVQFQARNNSASELTLSPLMLRCINADGSVAGAPVASSPLPRANAARSAGREKSGFNKKQDAQQPHEAMHPAPATAAAPPSLKMNRAVKMVGTCSECGATKTDVFPSSDPARDAGFYCAACWSRY
jgi:hypothetical protein